MVEENELIVTKDKTKGLWIDEETHRKAKLLAVKRGITMKDLIEDIINDEFKGTSFKEVDDEEFKADME